MYRDTTYTAYRMQCETILLWGKCREQCLDLSVSVSLIQLGAFAFRGCSGALSSMTSDRERGHPRVGEEGGEERAGWWCQRGHPRVGEEGGEEEGGGRGRVVEGLVVEGG